MTDPVPGTAIICKLWGNRSAMWQIALHVFIDATFLIAGGIIFAPSG